MLAISAATTLELALARYVEEPDIDAFHWVEGPKQPTYRVTFYQKDLWWVLICPFVPGKKPPVGKPVSWHLHVRCSSRASSWFSHQKPYVHMYALMGRDPSTDALGVASSVHVATAVAGRATMARTTTRWR